MRKFLITVEGKQYDVSVEEIGVDDSAPVQAAPAVTAAKPVAAAPAPKAAPSGNGVKMTSPMPGMVTSLKVEDGATVKKGQVVMILEAMKMENDLSAPADGTISFKVQKGANVDTGALLAEII